MRALWTAATGMQAQQLTLDVVANNLANVQTAGFKRSRIDFQDLVYETCRRRERRPLRDKRSRTGFQVGHGSRAVATQRLVYKGRLAADRQRLDLAIEGDGFFPGGTYPSGDTGYTGPARSRKTARAKMVTSDGFAIATANHHTGQTRYLGDHRRRRHRLGLVSRARPNRKPVGTIELARFINPAGLQSHKGRNLFLPTQASGDATPGTPGRGRFGNSLQGFVEGSNVNVVEEMVGLITSQRAYEINSERFAPPMK